MSSLKEQVKSIFDNYYELHVQDEEVLMQGDLLDDISEDDVPKNKRKFLVDSKEGWLKWEQDMLETIEEFERKDRELKEALQRAEAAKDESDMLTANLEQAFKESELAKAEAERAKAQIEVAKMQVENRLDNVIKMDSAKARNRILYSLMGIIAGILFLTGLAWMVAAIAGSEYAEDLQDSFVTISNVILGVAIASIKDFLGVKSEPVVIQQAAPQATDEEIYGEDEP